MPQKPKQYYGNVTELALQNFPFGRCPMPQAVITHYAQLKRATTEANGALGEIPKGMVKPIVAACDAVLVGEHHEQFPLTIYQTGSGTQTHMNVNEVLASLANERFTGKTKIHPNDHVNRGQSTNDTFPTVMHMASVSATQNLLPAVKGLEKELQKKVKAWGKFLKIGRTHLQDAVPMTLGQEASAWLAQVAQARKNMETTLPLLYELPIGGTAIGTGLNAHPKLAKETVKRLAKATKTPYKVAANTFAHMAAHDNMVQHHGSLKTLAVACMKIANDIRLLGSGPRAGLNELQHPANEPGSSIMPGKVNPTQCEAITQVCARVMGNDTTMTVAGMHGHLQLNVFNPVMVAAMLESLELLAGVIQSFTALGVKGLTVNKEALENHVESSLMLVTPLTKVIGYDAAASVAKHAHAKGLTLRQAVQELGVMNLAEFDKVVDARKMV